MTIKAGQQIMAREVLGLNYYPQTPVSLLLTNAYQDLVAAPASGIRRVSQLILSNEDSTVTTDFYVKLVKSSVDYVPFTMTLAPGERLIYQFPYLLDTTQKLQAKIASAATAHVYTGYTEWYGASGIVNFSGTAWSTIFTATASVDLVGIMVINTDTTSQKCGVRIIDGSLGTQLIVEKTLSPNMSWFLDYRVVLPLDYSVQVRHGALAKTGSAIASYMEI